jgi:hypothetical protein
MSDACPAAAAAAAGAAAAAAGATTGGCSISAPEDECNGGAPPLPLPRFPTGRLRPNIDWCTTKRLRCWKCLLLLGNAAVGNNNDGLEQPALFHAIAAVLKQRQTSAVCKAKHCQSLPAAVVAAAAAEPMVHTVAHTRVRGRSIHSKLHLFSILLPFITRILMIVRQAVALNQLTPLTVFYRASISL